MSEAPLVEGVADAAVKATPRDKVLRLQDEMLRMPQVDIPIEHAFADGVYARTMRVPAGVALVGKLHKTRHLWFLMSGKVTVYTEFGLKTYEAPAMIVSEPGEKRVIVAHTDVVWTNIHATNETDPEKIEREVISPTYDDLEVALLRRAQWPGLPQQ